MTAVQRPDLSPQPAVEHSFGMPSKSQPASHQTIKGGAENTKPDRAPGGPLTGRVPSYILTNLLHADPEEALPSTDGTVSKPDWLSQIRGKLHVE